MESEPFGTKLVFTDPRSTPLWVPKLRVPRRPPLPVATEQPGVIVALT